MTGFTPGPWERLEGFAEPGHPIYKPGTQVIRIVQKRAPGQTEFAKVALVDENVWANARLIAAAPELLEVVQKCREVFADYAEMHRRKLVNIDNDREHKAVIAKIERNRDMCDLCLAAIAKAEGRT